ncbi:hypothetical protein ACFSKN_01625, partial [Mariniflexile gromovii]
MKQQYFKKSNTKTLAFKLATLFFLFLCIQIGYSQVRVPFAPRANYTIKGDFTMIGNTNLQLDGFTYPTNTSNNNDMMYVDIDNDDNTFNSSSANLTFSTENGAIPDCSKIIYAGLYWTGRAFGEVETDPGFTFDVTKTLIPGGPAITKTFDKRKVSIKGPSASVYTELNATEIYFPTNGVDKNMYSAYSEITEYVQQNGIGEYFVADIALREGNVDATGYYGGWGIVVVYENSKMKWRDVTVFDGHAFVENTTASYFLNVSGFNAIPNGPVNLKLGLMAGEGDIEFSGDYFRMLRQDTGAYENLSYTGSNVTPNNSTNFFNSAIITGGNTRNPQHLNNTGLDIVMFDVDNANNKYINNNQTSTSFEYGSAVDTYAIFNITFSVEAYVPEPEGVIELTSVNGNPPVSPYELAPGESSEHTIQIKNTGSENTVNTVLTIPLPDGIDPNSLNITFNPFSLATTNVPVYNPLLGDNGSIVWNLETLPFGNPDEVLAEISLSLTVTTNCSILTDPNFDPNVTVNGTINGVGENSNVPFSFTLIQGYEMNGLCIGDPIPAPITIAIDYLDYISQPPAITAPSPINIEGCDVNDITALTAARYPYSATQSVDIKDTYVAPGYTVSGNGSIASITYIDVITQGSSCPITVTRTFTITNGCGATATTNQTININDNTAPTGTAATGVTDVDVCAANAQTTYPFNATTVAANYSDNCSGAVTVNL